MIDAFILGCIAGVVMIGALAASLLPLALATVAAGMWLAEEMS